MNPKTNQGVPESQHTIMYPAKPTLKVEEKDTEKRRAKGTEIKVEEVARRAEAMMTHQ